MGIGAKLNIAVKVGTSSTLKFNNVKAYRAITYNDISRLIENNSDISLIIIEGANESDIQSIENMISITDLNIYLYNPNFDIETGTTGLLQGELSSDHVYMFKGQNELQEAITDFYGVDVRTFVPVQMDDTQENKGTDEEESEETTFEETTELEYSVDVASKVDFSTDTELATNIDNNSAKSRDTDIQTEDVSINFDKSNGVEDNNSETEANNPEIVGENQESIFDFDAFEKEDISPEEENTTFFNSENAELLEALSASLTVDEQEEKEKVEKVVVIAGRKEEDDLEDTYIWDTTEIQKEDTTESEESSSSSEELLKLKEQIEVLNDRLKSEQDRANSYEELVKKLREVKESLDDKLAFNNDLLSKLRTTEDIIDISIQDSEETLNKLEELKIEKGRLQSKVNELTKDLTELTKLEATIIKKDGEYAELQRELEKAKQDNRSKEIEEQLNYEREIRLKITELLEDVVFKYSLNLDNYNSLLANSNELEAGIKKEQRHRKELEVQILDLKDKLQKSSNIRAERERVLNLKLEEFSRLNSENVQTVQSYERDKQKLLTEVTELRNQVSLLSSKETDYKSSISTLESKLTVQENIVADLNAKLKKFENVNIEELQSTLKTTDLGNTQLTGDIGRLKIEISGLHRQLTIKDEIIGRIESEKSSLELTAKALSNSVSTADRLMLSCNYHGKALIIPVFGSGSYGTTTTVMTLAKKLEGSVLILDFDCVNPSIDAWVEKTAIIKELKDEKLPQLMNSSFGALIEKGADFIIENQQIIVQSTNFGINKLANKVKKKDKRVDYFSGIYTKIDLYKFAAIDFSAFMNFFGNDYDYILVDLGRIGGNESTNALIRMFDTISWRNVMVCQNDKYDVRKIYTKCMIEKLHLAKSIWILNMSKSTALDDLTKKALGNANFVILTKKPDLYGEMKTFDIFSNYHKEKIGQVIDMIDGT